MAVCRMLMLSVAALALGVSACSSDAPEPEGKAQLAAAPSGAPSAATAETPEAFIALWAELEKDMLNTGDTAAYDAVTSPCQPCGRLADEVSGYYAAGGHLSSDGVDIHSVELVEPDVYEVRLSSSPSIIRRSSAAEPERIEGEEITYRARLQSTDDGYLLADLQRVA